MREPTATQIILDELREFRRETRESNEYQNKRIGALEDDVKAAKLLWKVACGVCSIMSGAIVYGFNIVFRV